jgi:hypothetical protein
MHRDCGINTKEHVFIHQDYVIAVLTLINARPNTLCNTDRYTQLYNQEPWVLVELYLMTHLVAMRTKFSGATRFFPLACSTNIQRNARERFTQIYRKGKRVKSKNRITWKRVGTKYSILEMCWLIMYHGSLDPRFICIYSNRISMDHICVIVWTVMKFYWEYMENT